MKVSSLSLNPDQAKTKASINALSVKNKFLLKEFIVHFSTHTDNIKRTVQYVDYYNRVKNRGCFLVNDLKYFFSQAKDASFLQ